MKPRRRDFVLSPILLLISLLLPGLGCHGSGDPKTPWPDRPDPPQFSTVFRSGTEGYHTFRIPVIVEAIDGGALLAFAEGRVSSSRDWGDIDLVMKRSTDAGRTWGRLVVLRDDGENMVNNPAAVVDRTTGRIIVAFTRGLGTDQEFLVRAGLAREPKTAWIMESPDAGLTWSEPREITRDVKPETWRWYSMGPVHGIQLTRGDRAGRLIIPCNHSTDGGPSDLFLGAHAIYSDDGSATWNLGAVDSTGAGLMSPSESTAVGLVDGSVYFNCRNQGGLGIANRAVTSSRDGGETFEHLYRAEPQITAPAVQASVCRYGALDRGHHCNHLLFSSPGDPDERRDLVVLSSFDEGLTWERRKVISPGPAAYSDIVVTGDRLIGILFESGDGELYERIDYVRFGVAWLLP